MRPKVQIQMRADYSTGMGHSDAINFCIWDDEEHRLSKLVYDLAHHITCNGLFHQMVRRQRIEGSVMNNTHQRIQAMAKESKAELSYIKPGSDTPEYGTLGDNLKLLEVLGPEHYKHAWVCVRAGSDSLLNLGEAKLSVNIMSATRRRAWPFGGLMRTS